MDERIYPGNPKYAGCYQYKHKNGLITYYVHIKENGRQRKVKVGRSDQDGINPKYVKRFRDTLMLKKKDEIAEIHPGSRKQSCPTLDEAVEIFKDWLEVNCRSKRIPIYLYNKHIKPYLGSKPMDRIYPEDILRLKKKWMKAGSAESSQTQIRLVLSRIYKVMKDLGKYTGPRPLDGVKASTTKNQRLRFLSVEEGDALLREILKRDRITYYQAALALYGGLRKNEILKLRPMQIDLRTKLITIDHVKSASNPSKYRYVEISEDLEQVLKDMMVRLPRNGNERYFLKHLNYKVYFDAVDALGYNKNISPKDRVNRVEFHTLRHSFASQMLESGSNLKDVQDALGHDRIESTMLYSHISNKQRKVAANRLDQYRKQVRQEQPELQIIEGGK